MKIYRSLNQTFVQSLKHVQEYGSVVRSRGSANREALFYSVCVEDPTALSIDIPARKFNPDYATAEWLWYLSKNRKVNNIGKLANIWLDIQDKNGECESNYGSYLLGEQWEWVTNELLSDLDTRRASLTINQPHHKGKNVHDYPCTQYIHFFIRENRLHLGICMRSNDAIFGFCNDIYTFCLFQQLMLNDLNKKIKERNLNIEPIELGYYYHSADSFHVYEKHWPMMDKILKNYYVRAEENGYPQLKSIKLKSNITSDMINNISLPEKDMTKQEIKTFVEKTKGLIYV